jgi:hypothetical protein
MVAIKWRRSPAGGARRPRSLEAAPEEGPLIDGVGRGAAQWGLGQELGVELIDPGVERIENRQRAPPPLVTAGLGIEALLFAFGLNLVQLGKEPDGNRGALVLGQQGW